MNPTSERAKLFLAQNGIYIALVALIALFASIQGNFLNPSNLTNILAQSVELGVVAVPLALLVISGSIDFSVGSIASLSAVVSAMIMQSTNSFVLGITIGILTGVGAGAINGFLVSYLRLNPFVVTLGFLSVWAGLALLLTNGRSLAGRDLPAEFAAFGTARVGPFPVSVLVLAVVVVLGWYVLNRTAFGKRAMAIGGNRRAAELMGVRVQRLQFFLFIGTGTGAALAGILFATKVQAASPIVGVGLEFDALTVVLLGGVAITGGAGRISGVVGGLLFFRVLRNGLAFLQASPFLQTILIGATLVVAIALDSSVQRVVKASWQRLGKEAPVAPAPANSTAVS